MIDLVKDTFFFYGLVFVFPVVLVCLSLRRKYNKNLDEITLKMLTSADTVEAECKEICDVMNNAPILDNEKECAAQMSAIVQSNYLSYQTLAHNPAVLLRTSRHFTSENGALGTRFTGKVWFILDVE